MYVGNSVLRSTKSSKIILHRMVLKVVSFESYFLTLFRDYLLLHLTEPCQKLCCLKEMSPEMLKIPKIKQAFSIIIFSFKKSIFLFHIWFVQPAMKVADVLQ